MSSSVALIGCSNGLGHIRRLVLIANQLSALGVEVVLFAPLHSVERVQSVLAVEKMFSVTDFDTFTSAYALRTGHRQAMYWEKGLPTIRQYDVVVSDNLPEILAIRPDAWLSGNFFWHESLPGISSDYRRRAENLISRHRPSLLTYGPFSSIQQAEKLTIFNCSIPQPLIKRQEVEQDALLICCGTGGGATELYRNFIQGLSYDCINPFKRVFVEPRLVPSIHKEWLQPADFSQTMFSSVLAAICRPGLGILSECIAYGIRIFPMFEGDNTEMSRNANRIVDMELGLTHETFDEALMSANYFASDTALQEFHRRMTLNISETTTMSAAQVLISHIEMS